MTNKIYTVTDLGPGDGGKGGVVHKISTMMRAHTVIKVGGAQGSHGVQTSRGESFAFSQWGCGTFEGIKTHLSSRMIISPVGLQNEANSLRYQYGIHDVYDLLTVDSRALCATPYHGIASCLKEMARGANPRGTIGTGVGEAYRDSMRLPDLIIRAEDLSRSDLKDLLFEVREQIRNDLYPVMQGTFLPGDCEEVKKEINLLNDDDFFLHIAKLFHDVSKQAQIVAPDYLGEEILSKEGVAVVESSHGILTDHFHGFHPHTSAIRTLPCFTHEMLRNTGYDGQIVNLGVSRAYQIRHGAGPMPTADPEMTESLLPGSNKDENRYQGKVRVGPLDLVMLRYAIDVCGGPTAFDGLAISWFDQIQANGEWHICESYEGAYDRNFFTSSGGIKVRRGTDIQQLEYQEALGREISSCKPEIQTIGVPSVTDKDKLYSLCADVIEKGVSVPVRMVSFGPTEQDKICK